MKRLGNLAIFINKRLIQGNNLGLADVDFHLENKFNQIK
jgi:hypothetical protein